ncbi:MAG: 50S ribosomal protein L35 [Acidimicrobiia bacterium]
MPRGKTHKGAAKRFKVTGSGKIRRRQAGRGHYSLAKGKRRYRRLSREASLSSGDKRRVKRLLS